MRSSHVFGFTSGVNLKRIINMDLGTGIVYGVAIYVGGSILLGVIGLAIFYFIFLKNK